MVGVWAEVRPGPAGRSGGQEMGLVAGIIPCPPSPVSLHLPLYLCMVSLHRYHPQPHHLPQGTLRDCFCPLSVRSSLHTLSALGQWADSK